MNAIQTLMDEHQTILRALAALEALASDPTHASEPVGTWRRLVHFFREYADSLHHGKEEDLLFPAMESAGIPEQGPTAVMRMEHEEGRALVKRLAGLAEAESVDQDSFSAPALRYVELLRSHIGKEDHILYPMARRLMSESAMGALDRACEVADEQNFEPTVGPDWEEWIDALATRLGVNQARFDVSPICH